MSKQSVNDLKPFASVLIIIITLLLIVFVKMEIRRSGYMLWKQARVEKQLQDEFYQKSVLLAKVLGPNRIHNIAQAELDMQKAHFGQIIQMTPQQVALKQ